MLLLAASLALAAPVPSPGPDWVTVKGTVVWPEKEKIPERKEFDLTRLNGGDADYVRKGGAVFDDTFLIDEKSRGLKNVVVWIRPDDDAPKAKFPAEKIHPDLAKAKPVTHTLTSEFGRFDKPVLALRAGDTLEVANPSPVPVAVRIDAGDDSVNHLVRPGKGPVRFEKVKPILGVGTFRDGLHNWIGMEEWPSGGLFRVFDHPYFAVTNDLGEFEIRQVPRGKWRIVYWHESGFHKGKDGRLGFPIEVEGNKDAEMKMKPLAFESPKK